MKNDTIYFRHTFLCPECENYSYRVTAHSNPNVDYQYIECGSCGKRIPMTTHHATDVCLSPVFDTDLICASILYGSFMQLGGFDKMNDPFGTSVKIVRHLSKVLKEPVK